MSNCIKFFQKTTIAISFIISSILFNNNNSQAFQHGKNVSGSASLTIGYYFQGYSGSLYKQYKSYSKDGKYNTNFVNHSIDIGLSYSFNYKINDKLSLFIGSSFSFSFTLNGDSIYELDSKKYIHNIKYGELLILNAHMGISFKLNKYLSLSPYYLIGMNAIKMSKEKSNGDNINISSIKVGMNTGTGIELLLCDKYVFAIEYKLSYNKMGKDFDNIIAIAHSLEAKVGLSFG